MSEDNDHIENIKKLAKSDNIIIGTDKTILALKNGLINKVYLAKNIKDDIKDDIMRYAEISNISMVELNVKNDELGVLCKKPFSISVLGQIK